MPKWLTSFTFALFLLLSPFSASVADATKYHDAKYQQAMAAYERGKYQTALRLFRELAEQGQVHSQRMIGNIYDKGLGVPQNFDKAVHWYSKAATQKDPAAQYHLGLKYANGHGVEKDPMEAYIWFAISFNNGYELAAYPLRVLNKSLSTIDRQEALKVVEQKMEVLGQ